MRKLAITALAMVAMTVTACVGISSMTIRDSRDSVVALMANGDVVCAGTAISDNKIITASHCVSDTNTGALRDATFFVLTNNSDTYSATVESNHPEYDVAILSVDGHLDAVDVAKGGPGIGEEVFTIGSPLGDAFQISKGLFVERGNDDSTDEFGWYDRLNIAVYPGSSGGGVFNDRGELVGVVSMVRVLNMGFSSQFTTMALSVPLPHIKAVVGE